MCIGSWKTYFIGVLAPNVDTGEIFWSVKIGKTTEVVRSRLKKLQSGSVSQLYLLHVIAGDLESHFHRRFKRHRLTRSDRLGRVYLTEWFRFTDEIVEFIKSQEPKEDLFSPNPCLEPYLFNIKSRK